MGQEVVVDGPLGPRRYDIVTQDANGNLHGIEIVAMLPQQSTNSLPISLLTCLALQVPGDLQGKALAVRRQCTSRRGLMKMKLEMEGKPAIQEPTESQVRKAISALRSYGSSSYASLTDAHGNYVQVAGGGVTCMLERYDAESRKRFRASHGNPSPVRPDGTILSFRAGNIPMPSDEWFMSDQVADVFTAFLRSELLPEYIVWRNAPGF